MPPANFHISSLPDELLLEVLRHVPEREAATPQGLLLGSRGGVERVCRRWRRLALSLSTHLTVSTFLLDGISSQHGVAAAVTACLAGRRPSRLALLSWPDGRGGLGQWHALAAVLPQLLCLELTWHRASSLVCDLLGTLGTLRCTRGLQGLRVQHDGGPWPVQQGAALDAALAGCISSLPGLRRVSLVVPRLSASLAASLAGLPCLLGAELSVDSALPDPGAYAHLHSLGTRLRRLQLVYSEAADGFGSEARPVPFRLPEELTSLAGFCPAEGVSLSLHSPGTGSALDSVEGLDAVPALRTLAANHSVPRQAWLCTQLTRLALTAVPLEVPPSAQLPALRRLRLEGCMLPGEAPPAAMLCAAPALTCLHVTGCMNQERPVPGAQPSSSLAVPAQLSRLRHLRELSFDGTRVEPASLAALGTLGLTRLSLPDCQLSGLPAGAVPATLLSLDIRRNPLPPGGCLPGSVRGAAGLRWLALSLPADTQLLVREWPTMRAELERLPRLQTLGFDFQARWPGQRFPGFTGMCAPDIFACEDGPSEADLATILVLRQLAAAAGLAARVGHLGRLCSLPPERGQR